jgi:hypothetical protein
MTVDMELYSWHLQPYMLCHSTLPLNLDDFRLQAQRAQPMHFPERQCWPPATGGGGGGGGGRGTSSGRRGRGRAGRRGAGSGPSPHGRGMPTTGSESVGSVVLEGEVEYEGEAGAAGSLLGDALEEAEAGFLPESAEEDEWLGALVSDALQAPACQTAVVQWHLSCSCLMFGGWEGRWKGFRSRTKFGDCVCGVRCRRLCVCVCGCGVVWQWCEECLLGEGSSRSSHRCL